MKNRIKTLLPGIMLLLLPASSMSLGQNTDRTVWHDSISSTPWTSGSGSSQDPFLIENRQQFAFLRDTVNKGESFKGLYFKLTSDLDFQPEEQTIFHPIATGSRSGKKFAGVFDGNHKTIYIRWYYGTNDNTKDSCYGLFGVLDSTGVIKNLTLGKGSRFAAYYKTDIGSLVGTNYGKVINCHNEGQINGNYTNVSSLVGHNMPCGLIDSCSNRGVLMGVSANGAIAGYNEGIVRRCANLGHSEGALYTGGIVGINALSGKVIECYNAGTVGGGSSPYETSVTGGIVAKNYGSVESCFNSGSIETAGIIFDNTAPTQTGGIIGWNEGAVRNCYNTGNISATGTKSMAGGIACVNGTTGSIQNTYSAARISCYYQAGGIYEQKGGASTQNLYYDSQLASVTDEYTTGMLSKKLAGVLCPGFSPEKWLVRAGTYPMLSCFEENDIAKVSVSALILYANDTDSTDFDTPDLVAEDFQLYKFPESSLKINSSQLQAQGNNILLKRSESADSMAVLQVVLNDAVKSWSLKLLRAGDGRGTYASPYLIKNKADLDYFAENVTKKGINYKNRYLRLESDLDLGGKNWTPIGNYGNRFAGNFDGGNHTISNMSVNINDYAGFFGVTDHGSSVKNLTIDASCRVQGQKKSAGGLAGDGYGNYDNCQNFADISGSSFVGGIVGFHFGGHIRHCYNTGKIEASSFCAAGIAGGNGNAETSYCFNTGNITAYGHSVAGIIGANNGNIDHCYNTGNIIGLEKVGGIAGRAMDSLISQCWNAGLVDGPDASSGAVAGVFESKNVSRPINMEAIVFDKQLCPIKDVSNRDSDSENGFTTKTLTSGKIMEGFDTNWIFTKGQYPILKCFADESAAQLSSAAVLLGSKDEEVFETVFSVSEPLEFTTPYGTTWQSSQPEIIGTDGTVTPAAGDRPSQVTLTARLNGVEKTIQVLVPAGTSSQNSELQKEELAKVYVTGNRIHVHILQENSCHVQLFNMNGQRLFNRICGKGITVFDVTQTGLYLIRIDNGRGYRTYKIIAGNI